jgi:hypothetical protein|tara:strand:+ start:4491 stop:4850 length:360 start_codon:yes stop_codon:yes gene_type:complete
MKIPIKLKEELASDLAMQKCLLIDTGMCHGRVEWHHSEIIAGRQLQEKCFINGVCWYHHRGEGFDSFLLQHLAFEKMTPEEIEYIIKKYPRRNWKQDILFLKKRYGEEIQEAKQAQKMF